MNINITLKFSNLANPNVDCDSNNAEELCSIADFLNDTSYIEFGAGNSCSSKDLYSSYVRWCDANALPPFKNNAFIHWLKDNSERLNIEHSKHIAKDNDINVRGFKGLKVLCGNNYILMSTPNQNDCDSNTVEELCNITDFLNDTSYIEFGAGNSCTSKELYSSYVEWCDANALPPFKNNAFIHWLKDNSERLNIEYSKHIAKDNDINVRGFKGLKILHGNNYILMSTPNQNDCNDDAINL